MHGIVQKRLFHEADKATNVRGWSVQVGKGRQSAWKLLLMCISGKLPKEILGERGLES